MKILLKSNISKLQDIVFKMVFKISKELIISLTCFYMQNNRENLLSLTI